jgi:asparaginyl-tRNA synthetase
VVRRTKIKTALETIEAPAELRLRGWVRAIRGQKKITFIQLNDGSCLAHAQVVVDPDISGYGEIMKLGVGAALEVEGRWVESGGRGQKNELHAKKINILGRADRDTYPLQPKRHSYEFLREIAHLRPRTNTFGAVFRVRHALAYATHKFYHDRGFVYVHTPIITASDCEGAGEMFQVTTLDLADPPRTESGQIDFGQDFFGRQTGLTVSGQLEGELMALGLGEIYTFGPTFRAENSNTPRHLSEFWMIEPEMAFYDLDDNMDLAEDYLKFLFAHVLEHCPDDLGFLAKRSDPKLPETLQAIVDSKFERITYGQAIEILENSGQNFEYPVGWGADLQTEHERFLAETHFQRPVIVRDYPKEIKAFYMRVNDDQKTVAAIDVLVPKVGEIIGGSQREERLDVLEQNIRRFGLDPETYWWYLDTRRFGTAPHSGFGLGFERTVQFVTGMANIRDVIPFPRTPRNAAF